MNHRLKKALPTLGLGVLTFALFAFRFPGHLYFHEQMQLLPLTGQYFLKTVPVPSGLADWTGEFCAQFLWNAPLGALVAALLVCGLHLMICASGSDHTAERNAAALLPCVLAVRGLLTQEALLAGITALILALALSLVPRAFKRNALRTASTLTLIPIAYMVCGPMAIVTAVCAVGSEWRRRGSMPTIAAIGSAALLAASWWISTYLFPFPAGRLAQGLHYVRTGAFAFWPWITAAAAALVALLPGIKAARSWHSPALAALALVAAIALWNPAKARELEPVMELDHLADLRDWDGILGKNDISRERVSLHTIAARNLAMACKGVLADRISSTPQAGPDGLVLPFNMGYFARTLDCEIFYAMGLASQAQRYAFETNMSMPDYRESSRCWRHLAETNIVGGYYEAALKYLEPLSHTLKYRGWALERIELLKDPAKVAAHPEYGLVRARSPRAFDSLFNLDDLPHTLGLMLLQYKNNPVAMQYIHAIQGLNQKSAEK